MLALAALLGLVGALVLATRRGTDQASQFADIPAADGAPQSSAALADVVSRLMAVNPANRGEAEATAMLLEDLANRVRTTHPQTYTELRRRAAELRTRMVQFPDPNAIPGGQSTVQDVASILTQTPPAGPSVPPTAAPPSSAPAQSDAASLAVQVAENLRSRARRYDRSLMKRFQRSVGLPDTGIYGTATQEALEFHGQQVPPAYTRTRTTFTPPSGYTQARSGPSARGVSAAADR